MNNGDETTSLQLLRIVNEIMHGNVSSSRNRIRDRIFLHNLMGRHIHPVTFKGHPLLLGLNNSTDLLPSYPSPVLGRAKHLIRISLTSCNNPAAIVYSRYFESDEQSEDHR